MTDRPIIFSAPMVRALLEGRKTVTRRMLKLPKKTYSGGPLYEHPKMGGWAPTTVGGGGCFTVGKDGERHPVPERVAIWHQTTGTCVAAPYAVGDMLWVKENLKHVTSDPVTAEPCSVHCYAASIPPGYDSANPYEPNYLFAEDGSPALPKRSVSSIHMPRWASRLTLLVTAVRIEKLQDISSEDAESEGVKCDMSMRGFRDHFAALWDRIHGTAAWSDNPWVVAISFIVIKANIADAPRHLEAA
jgi:hypothetical protein